MHHSLNRIATMDEDQDGGLFNIHVSDDEDADADADAHQQSHHGCDKADPAGARVDRTAQTEALFKAVKQGYHAKVENGDISQDINIFIPPGANKIHIQQLLHAVEELYFFRRYQDAASLVRDVFEANSKSPSGLDQETRDALTVYASKCNQKLGAC